MNIFVSGQNPTHGLIGRFSKNSSANWHSGDIIQATLTNLSNGKATLRASDDLTFTADAGSIVGQVGDTLSFRVKEGNEGFTLTQMFNRPSFGESMRANRGNATLVDGYEESKELVSNIENIKESEELRAEYRQERDAKMLRVLGAIRRGQNLIGGANKSVFGLIAKSGLDLSKISFAELNRVMSDIERSPGREISKEELAEGLKQAFTNPENAKDIITSLFNHGLNFSNKNISSLEQAWDKIPENIDELATKELIEKEKDLNLENIYKSCHLADSSKKTLSSTNTLHHNEISKEMIENFFISNNIKTNSNSLSNARFLLNHDLPLSQENLDKVQFLIDFKKGQISSELFFEKAASSLASDTSLGLMQLMELTQNAKAQLKLTIEAANRHQNLNIDVDTLRETVKNLQLNVDGALKYLKLADAETKPEQANLLTNIFDSIEVIKQPTVNVHAEIVKGEVDFTIKGVSESVKFAKAAEGYELNATVPDARYGDSFNKVKGQFAPLLENLGITATSENIKAAFILSKNKMDVTDENLLQVKSIDNKISQIINNLHPMIAATMIKEGLNLLEMHADELLGYIKQFNISKGESSEDKIAQNIMKLDADGVLDSEARKAMIAVYRMLNVIRKDGAAALGLAAQMEGIKEAPITLGEILNLAQTKKTDVTVSDNLGQLESLTYGDESIRKILENSTKAPINYSEILTEKFINIAEPETLKSMMETSINETIEDLAATSEHLKENSDLPLNQIEAFVSTHPEIINNMQKLGIKSTQGNIRAFEKIQKDKNALAKEVLSEEVFEKIPDATLHELRNGQTPADILSSILNSLGVSPEDSSIKSLLAVTHGLNEENEKGFQIPIKLAGQTTNLSMYVLNEKALAEDGARVLMSLDTNALGALNVYFTINSGHVDINITTETYASANVLSGMETELEALLKDTGVSSCNLTFASKEETPIASNDNSNDNKNIAETAYDFRV